MSQYECKVSYFFPIFANTVLIANLITNYMKQLFKWTIAGVAMLFAGISVHAQHKFSNTPKRTRTLSRNTAKASPLSINQTLLP